MKKQVLAAVVVFAVSIMMASSAMAFAGPAPSKNIVSNKIVTNEAGKPAGDEMQMEGLAATPETEQPATAAPLPTVKTTPAPSTKPTSGTPAWYKVRVGIFSQKDGAESMKMKLAGEGFNAFLVQQAGLWRVQVGAFKEKARAEDLTKELGAKGFQPDIIVTY
jgi:cell division septation protein DedD